jgi:prepilin-type N-terminal cleavage/methylation domain-containing protein
MQQQKSSGFTLLELLLVIAIIGILGAVGIPAYQGYVTKAKETKAQNTLQSIHMMEKNYFSNNFCYFKTVSTGDEGININITNIKHGKVLWVDEVDVANNRFVIMTEENVGEYDFYWDFTAIRKDVEDLEVEL